MSEDRGDMEKVRAAAVGHRESMVGQGRGGRKSVRPKLISVVV